MVKHLAQLFDQANSGPMKDTAGKMCSPRYHVCSLASQELRLLKYCHAVLHFGDLKKVARIVDLFVRGLDVA